ncbi:MAG: response regulator transcription factor [Sphaerochaetaceae bacterium]
MRVLIIEDEEALAEAIKEIFKKEHITAEYVLDGQEGLQWALAGEYDAIVLDLLLPSLDGISILKTLRSKGKQTPIILLTALSSIEDKVKGLDMGADDYLPKPFDSAELVARIKTITRRKGVVRTELKAFDLELDSKSAELKVGSEKVKLSAKEYQLMEKFLTYSGQIFSKEQLFTSIWGFENDSAYNTVEVYISFLRKKLISLQSQARITTTYGLGYALEG